MASDPTLSARINNARSDQSNLDAVKQKLSENLADIVLLRNVFNAWQNAYNANGGNNDAAYQDALKTLPKDNPTTSSNEGVTEQDFHKKAEQYFGKKWSDISPDDVGEIQNDLQTIKSKVTEYMGKSFAIDMQLSDLDAEIKDLTSIQQAASSNTDN